MSGWDDKSCRWALFRHKLRWQLQGAASGSGKSAQKVRPKWKPVEATSVGGGGRRESATN